MLTRIPILRTSKRLLQNKVFIRGLSGTMTGRVFGHRKINFQKEQYQYSRMCSLKIQDMLMEKKSLNLKKLWMVK